MVSPRDLDVFLIFPYLLDVCVFVCFGGEWKETKKE